MVSVDLDRLRGCLLGLAVGDAAGTTVEFMRRGSFAPVTDLVGGGPFRLQPGQWTDDTSMALCLATSLVFQNVLDPVDQMNRYVEWYRTGYLSSTGSCFDIGGTVRQALEGYERTGNPFSGSIDPSSAGNGCIMRLAPSRCFISLILTRRSILPGKAREQRMERSNAWKPPVFLPRCCLVRSPEGARRRFYFIPV